MHRNYTAMVMKEVPMSPVPHRGFTAMIRHYTIVARCNVAKANCADMTNGMNTKRPLFEMDGAGVVQPAGSFQPCSLSLLLRSPASPSLRECAPPCGDRHYVLWTSSWISAPLTQNWNDCVSAAD